MFRAKRLTLSNMIADMDKLTDHFDKCKLHRAFWGMYELGYIRRKDWLNFQELTSEYSVLTNFDRAKLEDVPTVPPRDMKPAEVK